MAKSKLVQANQKIAKKVTGGYKKIEETVVGGYKKIEDAFVDQYLTHEGESVEEAKERIHTQQSMEHIEKPELMNRKQNSSKKQTEA